jgi:glutamate---cysteine ligase / carboxylate-amine ligase
VSIETHTPPPTAAALRERFDAAPAYTVGIEDEVMVLDPETFELAPRATEILELAGGDPETNGAAQLKLELPASQLEIVTAPAATVPEAARALYQARRNLAASAAGVARFAAAGLHPSSSGVGELNQGPRYRRTIREYGAIAERQLVCALQVHVAVPGADRALAVYNAARGQLPLLAALAANAPFYEGRDIGLASVRAKIGELLPRQGVPPALGSWDEYSAALGWGVTSGMFPDPGTWWYELRPHPRFGTLELRVPDGQTTVADAAALAAVAQALLAWLGQRYDRGELVGGHQIPTWRIEQNRWSACRDGVEGQMADLETGAARPTRAWLLELLETLEPVAAELGAGDAPMRRARELVQVNGALLQRRMAAQDGVRRVASWLASKFVEPSRG